MQQVSKVFPTAHALIGMRSFLIENYTPEVIGNVFLHLLALDVAWIVFGVLTFSFTDAYVRKRGTLEKILAKPVVGPAGFEPTTSTRNGSSSAPTGFSPRSRSSSSQPSGQQTRLLRILEPAVMPLQWLVKPGHV